VKSSNQSQSVRLAVEIAVNLGLIFIIVAWCVQILSPFLSIIAWGAIIAISTYIPFLKLKKLLGGNGKLAIALVTVFGLALVIVPSWMFTGSVVESAQKFSHSVSEGQFHIPAPADSVKDWPLIGDKLYANWSEAAANFQSWLDRHSEQLRGPARAALSHAAGMGIGILQFILSILVAMAFLANAETSKMGMQRLSRRLAGERGEKMLDLSVATIRSVTVGVLGIAAFQALAGGIGMWVVGVPAAGVWALIILVLAIAQLPPWLVLLPVIFYVFSKDSTTVAVLFAIWSMLVSFSDMVLKPLLLGRGVEAPMLVILLGAIGGMILSGIMGLFVGAVVLALGFTLFQSWLETGESSTQEPVDAAGGTEASG